MASLCYTHSVHFLAEVSACVSEFQQSVSNLAMSLRLTAAEMAVDLMHRGTEGLAQSIYLGNHYASSFHEGFHMAPGVREGDVHDVHDELSLPSRVRFSALLESPILVLPRYAFISFHLNSILLITVPVVYFFVNLSCQIG